MLAASELLPRLFVTGGMIVQPVDEPFRNRVAQELGVIEQDILWTEKAHFAAATAYSRTHLLLGLTSTIAAACAAASVVAQAAPVVSSSAALIAAVSSAVLTFVNPQDSEVRHLSAARELGALRVRARQVISLDLRSDAIEEVSSWRSIVDSLSEQKAKIDAASPGTSNRAFAAARKRIISGTFDH